jgi:hypothetical protein
MIDPKQVAEHLLGAIDWQNEVAGYCKCPGESLHTTANGEKDCRVSIDGAPTIYCFHSSCVSAVAEANHALRQALAICEWSIVLPGGRVLRNGDVLQAGGEILRREIIQNNARARGLQAAEQVVLETIKAKAEEFLPELLTLFFWPYERIIADSPLQVCERDPEDHFRTWLKLWPAHETIWIGDVYSSGQPENKTNFRPIADWYEIGSPAMGNFTCGSAFKPGSFARTNENLSGHRFLVVESDSLGKDEVGAVFAYMQRIMRYQLHCIIDTAGKSLHAWFDAPRNALLEARLKVGLTAFGCDPKVFTYSQPVRVPGAFRDGKLQKLIWLRS